MSVVTSPWRHAPRWYSKTTWGAAAWQRALAALITAVIFWPQSSVDPPVGLDPSWQAALALARIHHLAWGPELVFTYGPLGFLQTTAYYAFHQSVLASVYQLTVVAALFLGIAAALRQRHGPMTSLIGAFITTGITAILHIGHGGAPGMMYPELAVLAAFAWAAVPTLQHHPKLSTVSITCLTLGAVAAFQLLVKLNTGLTILVIALAISTMLDWKAVGRHASTMTAFGASVLIFWLLAGQRLGDLPAWLRYSAAIVSGYSEAMAVPLPALGQFALQTGVLTLIWIGVLCVMFVRGGPQIPRRFVALVGLAALITTKKEFGRLGEENIFALLALVVVAAAITPFSGTRRRALVLGVVGALVFVALSAEHAALRGRTDPAYDRIAAAVQAPEQAVNRLVTLALPGRFHQRLEQAKARQRALYAIPERFIKIIGRGTVHIDPTETSAVWAYDLAWQPPPVFQTYQANTPLLDELNSESLAKGPQFVLSRRSPTSPATNINGRLGVQESPKYSRSLLCNFAVNGVEDRWALLSRTSPHCGPLTALSQAPIRIHGNDVITVPAPSGPGMAVLVGIDLDSTVIDRLFRGIVVPLIVSTVVIDGVSYRLVAANAAEPFLVNSPANVDGTNLQIHAHTIGVGCAPSLNRSDIVARLRFYEMRVAP